jgi:glycosyltransferase involved in cell wall biosynthesis
MIEGIQVVRGGGRGVSVLKARQWYCQQPKFDLVIDQHHGIPWYAPWWARTNCVAYIHEVLGPIWSSFYSWPLSALGQCQERWTHWLYRAVPFWTPSASTERALRAHGVRSVTVLANGTDATPLPALGDKPLAKPLRLVTVSRLAPNKRVEHALMAARLLLQRGLDIQLTVVGAGDVEGRLKQLAADPVFRGQVRFTGSLSEAAKNEELRRAHLLVHTSVREGWGLNVLEANAMGTPAVVYPVGGLVDSTVHGQTGIIASAETPESVAEAVAALAKSPETYERLRMNAWERSKAFQWSRVLPPACEWLEQQAAKAAR